MKLGSKATKKAKAVQSFVEGSEKINEATKKNMKPVPSSVYYTIASDSGEFVKIDKSSSHTSVPSPNTGISSSSSSGGTYYPPIDHIPNYPLPPPYPSTNPNAPNPQTFGPNPGTDPNWQWDMRNQQLKVMQESIDVLQEERARLREENTRLNVANEALSNGNKLVDHVVALDNAIREALDWLIGWNGQSKVEPDQAAKELQKALDNWGAQLL